MQSILISFCTFAPREHSRYIVMKNFIMNAAYMGVGFVALGAKRVQDVAYKFVEERNLPTEEGKKLVDDFFTKSKERSTEVRSKANSFVSDSINSIRFATVKEVDELAARLTALESTGKKTVRSTSKEVTA